MCGLSCSVLCAWGSVPSWLHPFSAACACLQLPSARLLLLNPCQPYPRLQGVVLWEICTQGVTPVRGHMREVR